MSKQHSSTYHFWFLLRGTFATLKDNSRPRFFMSRVATISHKGNESKDMWPTLEKKALIFFYIHRINQTSSIVLHHVLIVFFYSWLRSPFHTMQGSEMFYYFLHIFAIEKTKINHQYIFLFSEKKCI